MSIAERHVETTWQGSLAAGAGILAGTSGALDQLPVTWAARTEQPDHKTSPEELAAAAHSSCFSMALALTLGKHNATAKKLVVGSTVTLDEVDGVPTVVSSAITVDGDVPGMNAEKFQGLSTRRPSCARSLAYSRVPPSPLRPPSGQAESRKAPVSAQWR